MIRLHNKADRSPEVLAVDLIFALGFGDALDYAERRGQNPAVRSRSRAYWQRVARVISNAWIRGPALYPHGKN